MNNDAHSNDTTDTTETVPMTDTDVQAEAPEGTTTQLEVERKFAIRPGVRLPSLGDGVETGTASRATMTATYVDTPDLTLARAKTTLRRRTGGSDAAWHLKMPRQGDARLEMHAPLDDGPSPTRVPHALREAVADIVKKKPLVPVATLRTQRTTRDITVDGERVGELCDDTVTARSLVGDAHTTSYADGVITSTEQTWREVEVELTTDDPDLMERITQALAAGGVQRSESGSKLAQTLGSAVEELASDKLSPKSPAGDVVVAHLRDQVGVIQAREAELLVNGTDSVHKTRVATRRLRSALRTFRPLLRTEVTEPLRTELKWYAGVLGGPRDAEVQRDRLLATLAELPPAMVQGPVKRRMEKKLHSTHEAAHAALVKAMEGPRYRRLMDALVELITDPPFNAEADTSAKKVLPPLVAKADKKVAKVLRKAHKATGEEHTELLHEVRKKAKASRYAAESLGGVFGDDAVKTAKHWESVTEGLGNVQDSAVAVERLLEVTKAARSAGEGTFTYGYMIGREHQVAAADQAAAKQAIEEAFNAAKKTWK